MAHAVQQIRTAFVTRVTGLATTGSRVQATRVYPLDDDQLPGLAIYTAREFKDDDGRDLGGRERWDLDIVCEAYAKPADGAGAIDDVLDQICAEVQTAVMGELTLGSLVLWLEMLSREIDYSGELERPCGRARMVWRAQYYIVADAPEVIIYAPTAP
jgi:hypothetical protein